MDELLTHFPKSKQLIYLSVEHLLGRREEKLSFDLNHPRWEEEQDLGVFPELDQELLPVLHQIYWIQKDEVALRYCEELKKKSINEGQWDNFTIADSLTEMLRLENEMAMNF